MDHFKVEAEICIIEPFFGGSHKQLIELLVNELNKLEIKYDLYTLPDKKWHWKARCSALHFSQVIKREPHEYKILFASSVLNLAELIALRPDLTRVKKIIYFHENQLTYPVRKESTRNKTQIENKEQRDFQYGYNQILTSLAADKIVFNSLYNQNTFLANINSFLKLAPFRLRINTEAELQSKCSVLYFPLKIDEDFVSSITAQTTLETMLNFTDQIQYMSRPLNILWSHRWEHDKNPEDFFEALFKLEEIGVDFRLHVIGEQFTDIPEIFKVAKDKLKSKIDTWGYLARKEDYFKVISKCDLILSTSLHEFFGVAVIEACIFGAYPLLPNRLVYPELFPKECLYSTDAQLVKKLKHFCSNPKEFRVMRQKTPTKSTSKNNNLFNISDSPLNKTDFFNKFKWNSLRNEFISLLTEKNNKDLFQQKK